MNLYVMRHAEALPVGGIVNRDSERPLSPRGEEDAALMGRVLSLLDGSVDIVVTSPLVRAVQTGEIVGNEISDHPIFHVSSHLAPGFNHRALFEELLSISAGSHVVAIGHQPDMSNFVSFLVTGDHGASIRMATGSIVKLVVDRGRMHVGLDWVLSPDVVRALYSGS